MDAPEAGRPPLGATRPDPLMRRTQGLSPAPAPSSLADLLDRILDKGIIIAGDIEIKLLDIQLLQIRLRLLIASVDKADEMGIDWWRNDPWYSASARDREDDRKTLDSSPGGRPDLERRLENLEQRELSAAVDDRAQQLEDRLARLEQALGEKSGDSADSGDSGDGRQSSRGRGRRSRGSGTSDSGSS